MMAAAYRRPLALGDRGPIVSFTFDDFPRSAAQVAAPILESFGARGTYYVAPGLMNSSGEQGDLFVEGDLHFLMERGHEVASHTYDHSSCRSLSSLDFQKDVRRGIDAVHALTGGNPANFAYPFGHVTLGTKKALGTLVRSARGISPGLNGPEIDLNLLRANCLYGDSDQLQHAKLLIGENARRKAWIIFYTHDVRPKPSAYGCTPELFEAVVSFAANNCRILTVAEALCNAADAVNMQPLFAEQLSAQ